jgi:hypothetical protein
MFDSFQRSLVKLWSVVSPVYRRLGNTEKRLYENITRELACTRINAHYAQLASLCETRGVTDNKRDPEVIASLTTIPYRMHTVHLAIESVFQQSMRPDRVILWLDEESFRNLELPETLRRLQARGLEIQWCENIRALKKLMPAKRAYPEAVIVTFDDDALYPTQWLGQLYEAYLSDPKAIHAHRARKMIFTSAGQLENYSRWPYAGAENPAHPDLTYPVGIGGVLYPPGCFTEEFFNLEKCMELSPSNDDTWYFAMATLAGTPRKPLTEVMQISQPPYWSNIMDIPNTQRISLSSRNIGANAHATEQPATYKAYGFWDKLRKAASEQP